MLYSYAQLIDKLGSFQKLKEAIKKGKYCKVAHGIYSDNGPYLCECECIFARFPNSVLTLQSAFYFYDLSDYVPDKYVIATSQKAHKINNKKVVQIYMTDDLLNIGKTTVKTQYGFLNIYDKERMLIELFRLKSKLGYDYFREIVNSYRKLVKCNEINTKNLVEYAKEFKNGYSILKQIQDVVL